METLIFENPYTVWAGGEGQNQVVLGLLFGDIFWMPLGGALDPDLGGFGCPQRRPGGVLMSVAPVPSARRVSGALARVVRWPRGWVVALALGW